jgi:hypothetical protein
MPLTRGDDAFQTVGIRVVGGAFLVLVAAVVLGRGALVPVAAVLVGGLYGAELALADAPLDVAAPAVAAGLFLSVELAYWSIEERQRWKGEAGDSLRRAGLVALLAATASLLAAALLTLVDAARTTSLAVDLIGAAAAVGVFATIVVLAGRERKM